MTGQSLSAFALAELPRLRAVHPQAFAPDRRARAAAALGAMGAIALLVLGLWRLEISPARLLAGFGRLGGFLALMAPPSLGSGAQALAALRALGETLAMALVGTLGAALLALPLSMLAARNLSPVVLRVSTRRVCDVLRGIDPLVWALVFVGAVGLGPFAGVLAIAASDSGALARLNAEAIEAAERGPVEAVSATGATRAEALRFGLAPQVLPVLAAQALYFLESNVRGAAALGLVGAGGIGLLLAEQIRTLEWPRVAGLLLLLLAAVWAIDAGSGRLRRALLGNRRLVA